MSATAESMGLTVEMLASEPEQVREVGGAAVTLSREAVLHPVPETTHLYVEATSAQEESRGDKVLGRLARRVAAFALAATAPFVVTGCGGATPSSGGETVTAECGTSKYHLDRDNGMTVVGNNKKKGNVNTDGGKLHTSGFTAAGLSITKKKRNTFGGYDFSINRNC